MPWGYHCYLYMFIAYSSLPCNIYCLWHKFDCVMFIIMQHINVRLLISLLINSMKALEAKTLSLSEIHLTWLGLCTLCIYCFISGFAGVFTEYILKKNHQVIIFLIYAFILYMTHAGLNFILQSYARGFTPDKLIIMSEYIIECFGLVSIC